ncbi:hypothetical protein KFZ70_12380 [Tamlana fucoidanivorans]|uniref:DUF4179 domain-containing protein n=1 Tax=Allotamlana fucoidanivorans TaxID=2583814 RepID=A0A5C4SLQ9_9FLAO|nr:hypothetical protein [Tamlana fucoidanivorans]TNJ44929.1 hypothetical protein FGF67_07140 [Tamlana fucoidanivorans]
MDNKFENLFKDLEGYFDIETPHSDHENRFLNKLAKQNNQKLMVAKPKVNFWKPLVAVAASIILLISVFITLAPEKTSIDLASVSPKMAQTQDFFTATINIELKRLQEESAPEAQLLIKDALTKIKHLEHDYENLKADLKESGEDHRVIYAMISNFQNRIDILQHTLEQINLVKQLKQSSNETSSTI